MNHHTSKVRGALSVVFCYLLSASLFFLSIAVGLSLSVFNQNNARELVLSSGTANRISQALLEEYTSLGYASGFSQELFEQVLAESQSDLSEDVQAQIDSLYTGVTATPGSYKQQERLLLAFQEYAEQSGYTLTDELNAQLDMLAQACAEDYTSLVAFPFADNISPLLMKASSALFYADLTLAVAAAVFLTVLLAITHWRHRRLRYCINALWGAFLMSALTGGILLLLDPMKNFGLANEGYQNWLNNLVNSAFVDWIWFAFVFLAIGLACLPVYIRWKKRAAQ